MELQQISEKHFGDAPPIRQYGTSAPHLKFSQSYGQVMLQLGALAANAAGKVVPYAILQGPRDCAVAFLQGLFDADGMAWPDGYVEFGSRSEQLVIQSYCWLTSASLPTAPRKSVLEGPFGISSSAAQMPNFFYEVVGFRLQRKQQRGAALKMRRRGGSRGELVPGANRPLATLLEKTRPHSRAPFTRNLIM